MRTDIVIETVITGGIMMTEGVTTNDVVLFLFFYFLTVAFKKDLQSVMHCLKCWIQKEL